MTPKRVVIVATNWPALELVCPNWQGMKKGLEALGIPYKFVSCRPTLNIDEVVSFKPDLVIYGLLDMVKHPAWRREIKQKLPSACIVLWYGDLRNERTGQIDADCSELDMMFISNDGQEEFYQQKWKVNKVKFLPLGCEPIPEPLYNSKFAFPFVFIGGQITGSAFHLRASEIEGYKLNGGLTMVNSFEPDMRAKIMQKMPTIYSSSKICLDISHFTDIQGYTSIRYWEIPAFWGFALTKRFPGCEEFYPEDTRAYFSTFEEAMEKKEYYLEHEKERLALVAKAHELAYNHTYRQRFTQMFASL